LHPGGRGCYLNPSQIEETGFEPRFYKERAFIATVALVKTAPIESGRKPFVVDSHHKVLTAWADFRRTLPKAPRLLTLDHHTDTSRPFRRWIAKTHEGKVSDLQFDKAQKPLLSTIRYEDPESIQVAISKLNNDEHIVAGIASDIIASAHVIAHNAATTGPKTYEDHRITCYAVPEVQSGGGRPRTDYDCVLESTFLRKALDAVDQILSEAQEPLLTRQPYILDIDLDYFNTFKSIEPQDVSAFKALVRGAGLITIATEPDYVEGCAMDKGLTSIYLLKKLQALLVTD